MGLAALLGTAAITGTILGAAAGISATALFIGPLMKRKVGHSRKR